MISTPDPLQIAALVTDVLETVGARYSIGGSMASAFAGEPRSSLDVDVVVALTPSQGEAVAAALSGEFYVDPDALRRAIDTRGTTNLIHVKSSIKIDLFVAGATPLDDALLQRRQAVTVGDPPRTMYVHTPEDILLQKLRWFRLGDEASDRQWRDVIGIVRVQGAALDGAYLREGAAILGVSDLLDRALSDPSLL